MKWYVVVFRTGGRQRNERECVCVQANDEWEARKLAHRKTKLTGMITLVQQEWEGF